MQNQDQYTVDFKVVPLDFDHLFLFFTATYVKLILKTSLQLKTHHQLLLS